jgi:hypothetical protein
LEQHHSRISCLYNNHLIEKIQTEMISYQATSDVLKISLFVRAGSGGSGLRIKRRQA